MNPATLLPQASAIARAAGEAILTIYRSSFAVTNKADDSPLTEADLAAHRVILAGLTALTPEIPVISEEGEIPALAERAHWRRYWLVDPLDGTREFVARNGEFTVNLALIEDGAPVLGVVLAPALDSLYAAAAGGIAWREQAGQRSPLAVRSWPARPVLMLSRSHPDAAIDRLLEALGDHQAQSVGSSLKYCRIAEGLADAYPKFGRICGWDTAAGQCVLEQAGGIVLAVPGFAPLRYPADSPDFRNPAFIAAGAGSPDWQQLL